MTDQSLSIFFKRLLVVLATAAVLYMVFLARTPLIWIGVAAFLAIAINPIIHWLQKYMPKQSIGLATFVVLALFCLFSVALMWAVFVPLVDQTSKLIASLPELADKATGALANTPFTDALKVSSDQLSASASQVGSAVLAFVNSVVEAVVAFVTIVALMFFMTLEGKTMKKTSLNVMPAKLRDDAKALGNKVYWIINGYVIGNFLLSMMYGVASGLVLFLLGNPYYLILGLVAALLDLIPLVGSTIAAIVIGIVCVLTGQAWVAGLFAVFTIIYVQLENAVLNPMVYSKKVDISPLTVLVAVLIGAAIAGVMGTLLAIPVAATIKETAKLILSKRKVSAA